MLQDLRYALRSLRRKPLVAAVAVITLGLGIGGATAVFSVVEAVLLRPLPFREPDRLVRIWELTRDGDRFSFSDPNYLELQAESRTLQRVAAYRDLGVSAVLADGGEPQRITTVPVSASFLDVLGVRPQAGRMFSDDEDRPGMAERPVLLSDGLWRRRFSADAEIVGRRVRLDGEPFLVTAVMPPRFDFPGGADAWIPLAADPRSDRGNKELAVIGRLAPGATLAQLAGELREIARRISDKNPESNAGWSAEAVPFSEWIVAPRFRDSVWVLFAAVGLLLLLACANVANLLVVQAASRRGEMRVRAALGAARGRLVRQLFTESALLAVLGTGAGVLIAIWSVDAVRALGGGRVPRLDEVRIDGAVLAFACLAGTASCLAFGLAPALHAARVDLRSGMDEGLRHTAGSRRLRQALVVLEVALALLLLVSAGLMANSFIRLVTVNVGFDPDGTIAIPIEVPSARYPEDRIPGFYSGLLDRVRALPGVTAAGATSTNPFRQFGFSNSVTPEERAAEAPPSGLVQAGWRSVTPGFFEAMGIPVLSGRTFRAEDRDGAERVVVMSESLARRLWPDESALGKRIYWGGTTGRTRTVVGVTGDIRDVQLDAEPPPMLYVPHAQVGVPAMTIVVRTAAAYAGITPAIREILRELDGALPAPAIYEIGASRTAVAAGPRFNVSLFGAFAAIALVLAATGVYATLAFTVLERRREIAVRLALGASGPRMARSVLRNGLGLAAVGVAAGSVAARAVTRMLASLLYGVEPTDPVTFAAAAASLLVAAALACYLPARQASRLDPIAILRE
jgi:putative ABC transport system permease protein